MNRRLIDSKDLPLIRVVVTRDSVCLGDDCEAPHEKLVEMPILADPQSFVLWLSDSYLPRVAGKAHAWDCLLNGEVVGTIFTSGFHSKTHQVQFADENLVHFKYYSGEH